MYAKLLLFKNYGNTFVHTIYVAKAAMSYLTKPGNPLQLHSSIKVSFLITINYQTHFVCYKSIRNEVNRAIKRERLKS